MTDARVIGFIGLGRMGVPILENISRKFGVKYVFNRTPKDIDGHIFARKASELGASCDLVFLMLSDTEAVTSVLFGKDGVVQSMRSGSTIVDLSTILPSASVEIAHQLAEVGISYNDAPVIGSLKPANEGKLTTVFGGQKNEFEGLRQIISTYSSRIIYMGPSGSGSKMKIVNNLVMGINMAALAEGVALSRKLGLGINEVLDALASGGADSRLLSMKAGKIESGDYSAEFALKHQLKDINYAVETASEVGLDMNATRAVAREYHESSDFGFSEEDFSSLVKFMQDRRKG